MAQLFEFIGNHPILCLVFLVLLVLLFGNEVRSRIYGVAKTSVQQAVAMQGRNAAQLVDLRDDTAYAAGHILGAKQFSFEQLKAKQAQPLNKYKDKPIILIDSLGHQAVAAGAMLSKQGFKPLYTLAGGQAAWEGQHMPLDKKG